MKILSRFFGKSARALEATKRINEMMKTEIRDLHAKMTLQLGENQELKSMYEYTVFNLEERIKALESMLAEKEKHIATLLYDAEGGFRIDGSEFTGRYGSELSGKKRAMAKAKPRKQKMEGAL